MGSHPWLWYRGFFFLLMSHITSNWMCCTWVEMHSMVFMVFPRCYCCIPLSHLLYLLYTLNHHKSFLSLGNFPLSFSWLYSSISIHSSISLHHYKKRKKVTNFIPTIYCHFLDQKIGNVLGLFVVNSISVFWKNSQNFCTKLKLKTMIWVCVMYALEIMCWLKNSWFW
jgi:hypothetical protein